MHQIPKEFDPEFIKAKSSSDMQMYRAERTSREPMKSVLENNPEIYIVPPQRSSTWGKLGISSRLVLRHDDRIETPVLGRRGPTAADQRHCTIAG